MFLPATGMAGNFQDSYSELSFVAENTSPEKKYYQLSLRSILFKPLGTTSMP